MISDHPEYSPVSNIFELSQLNDDEILEGYLSVCEDKKSQKLPGSDKSKSFWHGWRNGMVDKKYSDGDHFMNRLANEIIETGYLNLRN